VARGGDEIIRKKTTGRRNKKGDGMKNIYHKVCGGKYLTEGR